jgi:hypothetical protein
MQRTACSSRQLGAISPECSVFEGGGAVSELDLVVMGDERIGLQEGSRLLGHFDGVAREHPLMEALPRRQRRAIAEHHVEEIRDAERPV